MSDIRGLKTLFFAFTVAVLTWIPMNTALCQSALSAEEREIAEALEAQGLFPDGVTADTISARELHFFMAYLREELGIEDIKDVGDPDPRFSTPESTWETHKTAMIEGDWDLSDQCLMPREARRKKVMRQALGEEKIQETAEAMLPIQRITGDEKRAKYRIHRMIKGQKITFYI
jgi:hypothetical protein